MTKFGKALIRSAKEARAIAKRKGKAKAKAPAKAQAKAQAKASSQPQYRVEETISRTDEKTGEVKTFWRVYYWAEWQDAVARTPDARFYWHPDSEHATKKEALARLADLKSGGKRQSIL